MTKSNGAAEPSERPSGAPRRCLAPKILSPSPCNRFLDGDQHLCHAHEGTDAMRRCEAEAGPPPRERIRCHAWPLVGLPYCRAHDPKTRAERQAEKESLLHQLGQVRAALTAAHPRIGQEVLELLVLERKIAADDVRAAMARYRVGGSLALRFAVDSRQ